jgi:bacterial/archaeal transporter family protein
MATWRMLAVGSAVFAALTAILAKVGVADVNAGFATVFRTVVVLIVSSFVVSFTGEWQRLDSVSYRSLTFLVLSGIATGLSWLCYFRALKLGPASAVAPIDKLSVVLVVIFATAFLGEPLTWKVGAGATLVTAGVMLLLQ